MIGISDRSAQRATDVGAVDVGQAEVEQHQVDVGDRLERGAAGPHRDDVEALAFEALHERYRDRFLVLDEEQFQTYDRRCSPDH